MNAVATPEVPTQSDKPTAGGLKSIVSDAILAALPTGLATGLGALPILFGRPLPRRAYDGVLGLGAGLMLAAATLGLLSEAIHGARTAAGVDVGRLVLITSGFMTGVLIAMAMDRLIPHGHARGHRQHLHPEDTGQAPAPAAGAHDHRGHHDHHSHDPQPGGGRDAHAPPGPSDVRRSLYFVLGAMSIHRLPEGVAIGAGFAVDDGRLGWMLSAAVALQNVCEGMVMAAPLRQGGRSPLVGLVMVSSTGLMVPVGAALAYLASGAALAALPFVLSLAGGTLIYVTSNEIIPESHSHGHERTASAGVIAGFLLTMLLDALIH
jgi:zinc transporter, ZIP family